MFSYPKRNIIKTFLERILATLLKIKVLHDAKEEPFLSKWFQKEHLNIWRTFLIHKRFFVVKEGSSSGGSRGLMDRELDL